MSYDVEIAGTVEHFETPLAWGKPSAAAALGSIDPASWFDLDPDQQAWIAAASAGIHEAYKLHAFLAPKSGVDLAKAPAVRAQVAIALQLVMKQVKNAYDELPLGGIFGAPFELKLPKRLEDFLNAAAVVDKNAEEALNLAAFLDEKEVIDVVADRDYERLDTVDASEVKQLSGLGYAVGPIIIGVVVAAALLVILWSVSAKMRADAASTQAHADSMNIINKCHAEGRCTEEQVIRASEADAKAAQARAGGPTDWGQVAKYAGIGVGALATTGLVVYVVNMFRR